MFGCPLHAGEGENVGLLLAAAFPFDDRLSAFDAADEKDVDWHSQSELTNRNAHLPVNHFVIWNRTHPEGQICGHSLLSNTRLGMVNRGDILTHVNGLTLGSPEVSTK
jgi:hypothetical protein